MTFAEYMERCLYDPDHGYYTAKTAIFGKEGDFYTSGYTHPLFAEILADAMAHYLSWFGERPLDLVELGPGEGILGKEVCRHLRERKRKGDLHYHPIDIGDDMPARITGIVFSNEFFDALPFHRVRICKGRPVELYVEAGERITESEGPVSDPRIPEYLERWFPRLQEGWDYEVNLRMVDWLKRLDAVIESACIITIDYGFRSAEYDRLSRASGTVMSYYRHQLVPDPYQRPGEQDITAHVNFDALLDCGRDMGWTNAKLQTQREFLLDWGLTEKLTRIEHRGSLLDAARVQDLLNLKALLMPGGISDTMKVLIQRVRA